MAMKFPVITVATLREIINSWPDHGSGSPSLVMLGSTHSDLGEAPLPAVSAAPLNLDGSAEDHLMIFPAKTCIEVKGANDDTDVLDVALAALTYGPSCTIDSYDPFVENALRIRAVNAIMAARSIKRKFRL
jgi:hypothetical protein